MCSSAAGAAAASSSLPSLSWSSPAAASTGKVGARKWLAGMPSISCQATGGWEVREEVRGAEGGGGKRLPVVQCVVLVEKSDNHQREGYDHPTPRTNRAAPLRADRAHPLRAAPLRAAHKQDGLLADEGGARSRRGIDSDCATAKQLRFHRLLSLLPAGRTDGSGCARAGLGNVAPGRTWCSSGTEAS